MKIDCKAITKIKEIARKSGVTSIRVFGSYADGSAGSDSDLDLLVTMAPGRDLLDLVAFKQGVEEALRIKVDVVTERAFSPYFREKVLEKAIAI